ncbi:Ldh family oxidoreductase [Limoniibacter endophyticus]|uniref:Sulfolactate dehydrogenase n=1 Tax=Limoniibacter endophyticus TaxID=1565040 RepID=A0A8J3DKW2_9HYPH|nr:Ldh family oxidoreductase [Limoniibacter endophyticus]GHC77730.1 sulfolactate dehydrogenase [Limoniibacter endophyticus]
MRLSIAEVESVVIQALERSRVSSANAHSVAHALVGAEMVGQGGHGLRRVEAYSAQAKVGKVDGYATPIASCPKPAGLRIDAGFGFAYPAIDLAVAELPALARECGIAFAAIGRSHHAGVMGLTVERLADQGCVAMMFANAPASMAPWGGTKPLFGTNPIAFAAPMAGAAPIVIDMALSRVARGKIMAAHQKGQPIPNNWAFDLDGKPTTDAGEGLKGTMIPAGEAKGAALALMVEILAAGLTGTNYAFEASSLFDDKGPAPNLGQMIIAIDPQAGTERDTASRLRQIADEIEADDGARVSGRRGQKLRQEAILHGIEVEEELLEKIRAI